MSEWFLSLLNRSVAAGWVVLAVLLLRLVLKKAPRWIHCALWGLVGLRLVLPFSLESAVSLLPSREVIPPETLYDRSPEILTGIEFVNTAVNESFTPAMTASEMTSVNPLQVWTWLAGWVWALGAAVLVICALCSYLRLKKRVAVSMEDHGLWRCDAIDSPFILGVFRPRIYVPSDLAGEDLYYVAAHERAHLHRKDHWWKPLGYLLLTVFWFHPLLWVGYVLLCRDIELACDEAVVEKLGEAGKKAYSLALVDWAVDRRSIAACPVAFGEVGVKSRVKSVLHYRKPAFWVVVVAVILCITAAVCLLTDPLTFSPDFDREDMALATTVDLRLNSGLLTGELSEAELDELWFRLRDLKRTRRGDRYGGLTPFYTLSLQLKDGRWIRIQGYALDGSMVDLVCGKDVYQVNDPDFRTYLDRICAEGNSVNAAPGRAETGHLRDPLYDGLWISTRCVYMSLFSSQIATADSGYVYSCGTYYDEHDLRKGERFGIMHRKYRAGTSIDVSDADSLEWKPMTLTDEEWAGLFQMEIGIPDISGYTDKFQIVLNETYSLFSMDGELWIMEQKNGYPWSIYALRRAETYEEAWWSYMEGVDADHRPMVLKFDMDFDQLRLDCDQGQLFGVSTNVNFEEKVYYSGQTELIYWTPLNEDGTTAADHAEIAFSVRNKDAVTAEGVLTIDRQGNCSIQVSGDPSGTVTVQDADFRVLFTAGLPAQRPPEAEENGVYRTISNLRHGDLIGVSHHNGWESIDLEHLRKLLQEALQHPVKEPEQYWEIWTVDALLQEDRSIRLSAGLTENTVSVSYEGEWLHVEHEELYRLVRTCYDTPPAGVDEAGYAICRELVDAHLRDIPELPMGMKKEQITKELTGFVLHDSSETLHAQAWRMDVAWNVDPPEMAYGLCAGASRVNSDLQLIGANASQTYVIVVDGEPIGFVGWWFLMDKTLDEQFRTKEALIEAVRNDG